MTTINVGLDVRGGRPITPGQALAALRVIGGWRPSNYAVHQSASEPTLVAEGPPLNYAAAFAVASALKQDAIAIWDGREGDLIGPVAHAWGDFNPAFFLNLDGSRLTPLPVAA